MEYLASVSARTENSQASIASLRSEVEGLTEILPIVQAQDVPLFLDQLTNIREAVGDVASELESMLEEIVDAVPTHCQPAVDSTAPKATATQTHMREAFSVVEECVETQLQLLDGLTADCNALGNLA
ncbi:hypothetical protein KIPB_007585, partial [Kipferlia bialata]|eukprot:g7585.t1